MQDVISHDLVEHADNRGEEHFSYRAGSDLWRQIPPFEFRVAAANEALTKATRSLGVLAFGLVAVWVIAVMATSRLLK
jgi:ABC-2 type transport system permease protein